MSTIRKAARADLDAVCRIYDQIHTAEERGEAAIGWQRGVYPERETAEAALTRGVKVTGATVHYVNEIPDGGRILLQKAVDVLPDDTPQTLQRRVMEQAEWILLPQAAEMVAARLQAEKEGSRA